MEPIFEEIEKGNLDIVTQWLTDGHDGDYADTRKRTLLMRAAYAGHTECCRILLDAGADILARTDSDNALSDAARQGHEETAVLLMDRGAECIVEAFFGAIDRNLVSVMDRMLKTVPDLVMARGHLETTPLIIAVKTGSIPMIKRLLEAGANIDDQDDKGWSALMHATYRDEKDIITFLREAGANEKLKDSNGMVAADLSDDFYDYDAD